MSKAVAEHINALHSAREAFIKCESDQVLKQALESRIHPQGQDISPGDWIYFKNKRKWEGPVKVTTKDGKLLFAIRKGRLLTINSDHASLAKFEGTFIDNPTPTTVATVSSQGVPESDEQELNLSTGANQLEESTQINIPDENTGVEARDETEEQADSINSEEAQDGSPLHVYTLYTMCTHSCRSTLSPETLQYMLTLHPTWCRDQDLSENYRY